MRESGIQGDARDARASHTLAQETPGERQTATAATLCAQTHAHGDQTGKAVPPSSLRPPCDRGRQHRSLRRAKRQGKRSREEGKEERRKSENMQTSCAERRGCISLSLLHTKRSSGKKGHSRSAQEERRRDIEKRRQIMIRRQRQTHRQQQQQQRRRREASENCPSFLILFVSFYRRN